MLRIGKLTDYATRLMTCMAEQPEAIHSAMLLAERARLELPTVSKLLKLLAQAGLIESFRGVSGGYRLAYSPNSISVADIIVAIEGPIGMTECSIVRNKCTHEPHCNTNRSWRRISSAIEAALKSFTLAEMVEPTKNQRRKAIPVRIAIV